MFCFTIVDNGSMIDVVATTHHHNMSIPQSSMALITILLAILNLSNPIHLPCLGTTVTTLGQCYAKERKSIGQLKPEWWAGIQEKKREKHFFR